METPGYLLRGLECHYLKSSLEIFLSGTGITKPYDYWLAELRYSRSDCVLYPLNRINLVLLGTVGLSYIINSNQFDFLSCFPWSHGLLPKKL